MEKFFTDIYNVKVLNYNNTEVKKMNNDIILFWNFKLSSLLNIAGAIGIVLAGLVLTQIIIHFFKKAMKKASVDLSLVRFFIRCIRIACYTIILISALSKLGISTTGLIAGFSAAAAALVFALKDSLSDIASGIVILFTRPFVTGDFIVFGDHKGYVQKIDMMHTNILTYDNTNVIIPNRMITTDNLNNYTAHPEIRVQIAVPIGYDADIDEAKAVILKAISGVENIITDVEKFTPVVRVENFKDSSIELMARTWTHFENYWQVYYSMMESIKKSLDKNDIPIPFNQLDVHIKEK